MMLIIIMKNLKRTYLAGREELQPAKPSSGCPRQHGYFAHPDTTVCNKFNFCVDGVPNTITCAGGLIFDPSKGQCDYADQTSRPGCTSDELFQFQCPLTSSAHEHSRHPDVDGETDLSFHSSFSVCAISAFKPTKNQVTQ